MSETEVKVKNGIITDNPQRKSLKIWSNKTNTYYYQSRDAEHYRNYHHERKQRITCEHCGRGIYAANKVRHQSTTLCRKGFKEKAPTSINESTTTNET